MSLKKSGLFIFMICLILLSACSGGKLGGNNSNLTGNDNQPPAQTETTPVKAIAKGEIIQKNEDQWLITTYVDKGEDSYVDAYWFKLNDSTELLDKQGAAVAVEEVPIGSQVEAWHDGKVVEISPGKTNAVKIIILDDENYSTAVHVGRAAAIRFALDAQTELGGTWAIKQAALDSANEFWSVELVQQQHINQPITVRLNAKTGEIVPVPAAENDAFRVYTPRPDEELGPVFHVEGEARVFEAAFSWHLEDGHTILDEGHVTAEEGAPGWGKFQFDVSYEHASQPNIMLFLYVYSAKDGSIEKQLIIPLKVPKELIKYSTDK